MKVQKKKLDKIWENYEIKRYLPQASVSGTKFCFCTSLSFLLLNSVDMLQIYPSECKL